MDRGADLISRRKFLKLSMLALPKIEPLNTEGEESSLDEWLKKVKPMSDVYWEKIKDVGANKLVKKGLTDEQLKADFDMYFPAYMAAEEKYGVRWEVLFMIHARETVFTQKNFDQPRRAPYGAMQIHGAFFDEEWREEALKGYEFLTGLATKAPKDAREIMAAGKYLDMVWNNKNEGLKPKDWDLAALDMYQSGEDENRVRWVRELLKLTRPG